MARICKLFCIFTLKFNFSRKKIYKFMLSDFNCRFFDMDKMKLLNFDSDEVILNETEKAMTDINCTFYVTDDFKHWICEECFNDFKDRFNWLEASNYIVKKSELSEICY